MQDLALRHRIGGRMGRSSTRSVNRSTPEVFTVGYEGRTIDELVGLLRRHRVRVLVDVRLNAISRRRGFSKTALAGSLADAGIDYVHEPQLGNPKENRPAFREGRPAAHRKYLKHVERQGTDAVARLTDLVASAPTALLCFEQEPESCHRTTIAKELGFSVVSL